MGNEKAPEKFVVGEKVGFYHGEDIQEVTVTKVEGDVVTAKSRYGFELEFSPRADGKHVTEKTRDFAVMPDMLFHFQPEASVEKKPSFWERVAKLFS
jgi:hypothetical protein